MFYESMVMKAANDTPATRRLKSALAHISNYTPYRCFVEVWVYHRSRPFLRIKRMCNVSHMTARPLKIKTDINEVQLNTHPSTKIDTCKINKHVNIPKCVLGTSVLRLYRLRKRGLVLYNIRIYVTK